MVPNSPESRDGTALTGASVSISDLVARYHVELYRYAYRLTGTADEAEDLLQQVFLTAHARLDQLQQPDAARGWLYSILRNTFLKRCRRENQRPAREPEVDLDSLPDDSLEENFESEGIDREQLQAALDDLPEEFRIVLLMFYFEDLTYREIAERLSIPAGTVMSRLSRAKGHLRQRLFAAHPSATGSLSRRASHQQRND